MMTSGPTGSRRRLRMALRRLREAARLTQEQVAEVMEWSLSKVLRIEAGTSTISINDLRALLSLYGVSERKELDELLGLSRASRRRIWWSEYREHLSPSMTAYLGLESEALVVHAYALSAVPSLLQTAAYAREVLLSRLGASLADADRLVELHLRRRDEMFERPEPVRIQALLDEGVLQRVVGGTDVMVEQLRFLQSASHWPHGSIRVVPFHAHLRRVVARSFQILDFGDEYDPGVLMLDGDTAQAHVYEDGERLTGYREMLREFAASSLDEADSSALIEKRLSEL